MVLSLCFIFSLSTIVYAVDNGNSITLYASPEGTDQAAGTIDFPLSVEGAKELLKKYKGMYDSATVYLLGGTYYFDDTLNFTSDDMPNVRYEAYEGEVVEFSGAEPIRGFEKANVNGVNVFKTKIDTSEDNWYFKSLFKGKKQLSVPRFPEKGYFTVKATCPEDDLWTEENKPWEFTLGQRSFIVDTKDVSSEFHNFEDVNVRILHYWHDELMNIKDMDLNSGKISLTRASTMLISDIDRYYFENVFEALNEPGEWYLDSKSGELYYVPEKGDNVDELVLYGSTLKKFVDINGIDGITFKGIRFMQTDWEIPKHDEDADPNWYVENDIDFAQAAINVKGVFNVKYAKDIHVINCEFINIGGSGVEFLNGVKDSSIENCYFNNIAATGIFVGGKNCYPEEPDFTENIIIRNNEINKYGRKFFCGIGIHITFCDNADVVNNEIHNGYYTGISCGWLWGYDYNATNNINISRNLIYDIGQGWLSDMGGIYMLGKQPGTVISENVIHNVSADPGEGGYGGWGIYLDEGSSYMRVEKNLVFSCGSQGLNLHYGEGNLIRNNISALNKDGQVAVGNRDEGHSSALYCNNIYLTKDNAPIYLNMLNPGHFSDNGNLMWSLTEDNLYFDTGEHILSLNSAQKSGYIKNALIADPLFKDVENFDFTLAEDSPAFSLYFEAWDYSVAGTEKDTVIGIGRLGGLTKYNDNSEHQPENVFKHNTILYIFYENVPMIICVFSMVILAFWFIVNLKDNKFKIDTISVIVLMILSVALYYLYIEWIEIAYYIVAVLYGLFLTIIPYHLRKFKKSKRLKLFFIVHIILAAGIFLGLTGIFNFLIASGSPIVILLSLTVCLIYTLVNSILCVLASKKAQ